MGLEIRPSALFVTPEAPYPLMGGGALRTASLLHYLARGYVVDMIVFCQPGEADPVGAMPPGLVRDVFVMQLPRHNRGTTARVLRNAGRMMRRTPPLMDRFAGFGDAMERSVNGRRYDVAVIEHFWCAPYAARIERHAARLVLDLHNIESELHALCAETERGGTALAHGWFGAACRQLERKWLPKFGCVLTASPEDAARVAQIAPGTHVTVYPNAIPAKPLPPRREEHVVAFSGNMEYHPNVTAARFFRREIWPLLRKRWPDLRWRLIGRNPQAVARYTEGDDRIETTGEVADAVAELARSKVAVAPLLAGSGTRFKILEAWVAGVPVVSTKIGAEGLAVKDGKNILLADTAVDFAAAVSRLLESGELRQNLGQAGRTLLEDRFTWESAWKMLHF